MSVILFFTLRGRQQQLTLDATLSVSHSSKVNVTKHPVEVGAKITDHVRPDEEQCQLEGLITDTPLDNSGTEFVEGERIRSQSAAILLYDLQANATLITAVTTARVYKNMVLQNLQIPEEKSEAIRFTATLDKLRFATTKTASPNQKNEGGSKPTRDGPPAVAERQSWLFSMGNKTTSWYTLK